MKNFISFFLFLLTCNFGFSQNQLPEIFNTHHCNAILQIEDYTDEDRNICIVLPTRFGSIIHLWLGGQYYEITNYSFSNELKEEVFGMKLEMSVNNKYIKFTNLKGEFYSIDKS
jgi:hypothetical protein